jgi:hypothetical protein
MEIILSENAVLGSQVDQRMQLSLLKDHAKCLSNVFRTFFVLDPANLEQARARISGPLETASCDAIFISGLSSIGGGGKPLVFDWSSSPASFLSGMSLLQSTTSLALQPSLLQQYADTTVTFHLTVNNTWGSTSTVTHTLQIKSLPLPKLQMSPFAASITPFAASGIRLSSFTSFSSCATEAQKKGLTFAWTCDVASVVLSGVKSAKTSELFLKPNTLPPGVKYTFTLTATDARGSVAATVEVTPQFSTLITQIKGGDRVHGVAQALVLDGSLTNDPNAEDVPFSYSWACSPSLPGSSSSTMKWTIAAHELQSQQIYTFTLTASKGSRSSASRVRVRAVGGVVPIVDVRCVFLTCLSCFDAHSHPSHTMSAASTSTHQSS